MESDRAERWENAISEAKTSLALIEDEFDTLEQRLLELEEIRDAVVEVLTDEQIMDDDYEDLVNFYIDPAETDLSRIAEWLKEAGNITIPDVE